MERRANGRPLRQSIAAAIARRRGGEAPAGLSRVPADWHRPDGRLLGLLCVPRQRVTTRLDQPPLQRRLQRLLRAGWSGAVLRVSDETACALAAFNYGLRDVQKFMRAAVRWMDAR